MNVQSLLKRAINLEFLSIEEGVFLYEQATTAELMFVANDIRKIKKSRPGVTNKVTWIIDRNVNTTNVCIANCKFCNFYRIPGHAESYVTSIETYKKKIDETFKAYPNRFPNMRSIEFHL